MKVKVFYNKEHHFWFQIFYSYGHVFVMILKRKNPGTINWDVTWWILCRKAGVLYYSTTMVLQICAYTIVLLWYCRFAHYQSEWIEAWQGKEIDLKQVLWQEPRPTWLHLHWQDCASIDLPLTRLQCAINFERRGTAFLEILQTLYYPFEEFQINCHQCHWQDCNAHWQL